MDFGGLRTIRQSGFVTINGVPPYTYGSTRVRFLWHRRDEAVTVRRGGDPTLQWIDRAKNGV